MLESFPSPDFAQRANSAQARLDKAKADLETLKSRIGKIQRNREALEVSGRNPDDEMKRTRDEIRAAEVELAHARQALLQIFSDESTRFATIRQKVWEAECFPVTEATKTRLAKAVASLREISRELSALKSESANVGPGSVTAFDASILEFNSLVAKYGAPGNHAVSPSSALVLTFQRAIFTIFNSSGLEQAADELRAVLNLGPVGLTTGFIKPDFNGKSAR